MKTLKDWKNFIINEGEDWINGQFDSNNYKDLVKKVEGVINSGKKGASFSFMGKDFTIVKTEKGFHITSGTGDPNLGDFGFYGTSVESSIRQAYTWRYGK